MQAYTTVKTLGIIKFLKEVSSAQQKAALIG